MQLNIEHITDSKELITCVKKAANYYKLPELLLFSILKKEGGELGKATKNNNGSEDLGPFQINTINLEQLAKFGYSYQLVKNNACANAYSSAWIFSNNLRKFKDLYLATATYNIGPYASRPEQWMRGYAYANDVFDTWRKLHKTYSKP